MTRPERAAFDSVKPNPAGYELAGMSLWGRAYCSVSEFAEVFGHPHEHDPDGEHVQNYWYFETPRGRVCVRDWHSSPADQLSICSIDSRAALWTASFFRTLRIGARGKL
ncbi:MAG: hypothetical protein GY815_07285 [Gammaproteobacteria bacterium]|nr:hypothetical protein [Gammaproteobacteria bacterium]